MEFPHYYCPKGVARPAHLPASLPTFQQYAGKGIDAELGVGPGGGTCYGGPYAASDEWTMAGKDGWWLLPGDCPPQDLVRMDQHPRIRRWTVVTGADARELWCVPVLIEPDPEAIQDGKALMYRSALDRTWNGSAWESPRDLLTLAERLLRMTIRADREGERLLRDETLVELVVEILGLGHHVSRHELVARAWLTEVVLLRVIMAAAAIPVGVRHDGPAAMEHA